MVWLCDVGSESEKQCGTHSTWMMLNSLTKARFDQRPAGHWVTFTTEVLGIHLTAIAYARSHAVLHTFYQPVGLLIQLRNAYLILQR